MTTTETPRESVYATVALCFVLVALPTMPGWLPRLADAVGARVERLTKRPAPMPTMPIPPLHRQVRCPDWNPLLSRTVVIFVDERDDGTVAATECIRVRERGRRYVL